MIIDLLKNMIYFSDEINPVIAIGITEENKGLILSFSNNTVISKNAYDLFKTGKESLPPAIFFKKTYKTGTSLFFNNDLSFLF